MWAPHFNSLKMFQNDSSIRQWLLIRLSTGTFMHFIHRDHNGWSSIGHWLIQKPYLVIIGSNEFPHISHFSNCHLCVFSIGHEDLHCRKQFIQHTKAKHFNDATSKPNVKMHWNANDLQGTLKNSTFIINSLNYIAQEICTPRTTVKYEQNPQLLHQLLPAEKEWNMRVFHDRQIWHICQIWPK